MEGKPERIAVIGAGPVGTLQACVLADKGYNVSLYEMRDDIRKSSKIFGRSINLALSVRGRTGLKMIGLEDEVTSKGIEMYGRMIHRPDGATKFIQYGRKDQHIMSIDRRKLNEILISAAESRSRVTLKFQKKLISCDIENKKLTFKQGSEGSVSETFDVVMGCDGAYSMLRTHMMKNSMFDFSQEFIEDGYMELRIPPSDQNQFALDKNCLHIWPRGKFMMIGLPNAEDRSFVMTLFMPMQMYHDLDNDLKIIDFFRKYFKDALDLITEKSVLETFEQLTPLPMVSIKCSPYNYKTCGVLLGDSAHAMVPFYGQGLNCGFEDVKVFDELMTEYADDFEKVLPEFSKIRSIDAKTMNDLAMYNYHEMRDHVNSKWFLARKMLDNFLNRIFPNTWIPLYTTVAFSRLRYHRCLSNKQWQDKTIRRVEMVLCVSMLVGLGCVAYKTDAVAFVFQKSRLLFQNLMLKIA